MPFTFVSTPIGNLGDLSFRALEALKAADLIYCEDTRHSAKLLTHYGVNKPLIRYDDHATDQDRGRILSRLSDGQVLVYISDAGTPMISDPGFQLARALREAQIEYDVIPGANAILPALQLSGLPCDQFAFAGFLPRTPSEIRKALKPWMKLSCPTVFYQSPKRINRTLAVLAQHWPDCTVSVVKEITKIHQQSVTGSPETLVDTFGEQEKGEFVLIIAPSPSSHGEVDLESLRQPYEELVRGGMKRKPATRFLADRHHCSSKALYEKSLEWDHQS